MRRDPYIQIGPFKGLNTVDDPRDISTSDLTDAINVNFDNEGDAELRDGRVLRASGNIHSLWSDKTLGICLFVEGTELKRLLTDWSKVTLRTGLTTGLAMTYAVINSQIWYSNGEVIGYIENLASNSLSTPTQAFKSVMVPGDILEFHNNRLYAVKGNTAYFSDPMAFGRRDRRFCRLYFPGLVTLFKSVQGGVFISFGGKTYFMAGTEPDNFSLNDNGGRLVADYGAIAGTAIDIERKLAGAEGVQGKTIMWDSEKGICLGTDGGGFENLTIKRYSMPSGNRKGASIYREKNNGIGHFISVIRN